MTYRTLANAVYDHIAEHYPGDEIAKWWRWVKLNSNKCRGTLFVPPGVWNTGSFNLPQGWTYDDWKNNKEAKHG